MVISIQTGDVADELGAVDGYKTIAEIGFNAVDWSLDHAVKRADLVKGTYEGKSIFEKSMKEIKAYYEPELAQMKSNGLSVAQAHAPFPAYIPSRPEVMDYMIEIYRKMIMFCNEVGCKYLVIHGISLAKNDKGTPSEIRKLNDKLYMSLIPTLLESNVTVCLENLFTGSYGLLQIGCCSDPHEAVNMIDTYNSLAGKECFGLCLDTGHLNLLGIDPRVYIPILGKRIKCLHAHDNDGLSDQHKAPYTGTFKWSYFCDCLKDIGYSGAISFETFGQTRFENVGREMVEPWLRLIYEAGRVFAAKIGIQE